MIPLPCHRRLLFQAPGGFDARCLDKPPPPPKAPGWRLGPIGLVMHFGTGIAAPRALDHGPCANPCPARLRLLDVLRRRLGGSDA